MYKFLLKSKKNLCRFMLIFNFLFTQGDSPFGKSEAYVKLEQLGEGSYATVFKGFSKWVNLFIPCFDLIKARSRALRRINCGENFYNFRDHRQQQVVESFLALSSAPGRCGACYEAILSFKYFMKRNWILVSLVGSAKVGQQEAASSLSFSGA